ncbi:MAG: diaminopropionate ammonia-lyase, partial [Planctomycetales bacterium]|nr:diaminopropionate ammonia-lyase [Planctomycetales bacterium]
MKPPTAYAAELAVNPLACRGADYGPAQTRILNADGLNAAKAIIGAWPGYQPTPLVALDGLARAAGVKSLYYKDEAHRFGLQSFKP